MMNLSFFRFLCFSLVVTLVSQAALSENAPNSKEQITVSFNNADALDVIRWAADLTNKSIIVSDKVRAKNITVIAGEPMNKQEAYEAFLAIMQVNNLVVVETDTALKIFQGANAKANAIPMIDGKGLTPEDFVMHIVKIKNVAAQALLGLLQPLVSSGTAQFKVHAGANIILIADYKSNVEKIVRLIEKIDKAGTIDVEFIELQHASAKEVVDLVSSLVPKIIGADAKAAPSQSFSLAADERSNSILMSGDTVLRTQMRKLIKKLDRPLEGEGNTQVIYLDYADAKEMADMLKGISGSVIKSEEGKTTISSDEISIVASEANNALVITAPPSLLNTIKSVIEKLDVRREQVLVEALLVEVNEDIGRQLGMIWNSTSSEHAGQGAAMSGSFDPAGGVNLKTDPLTNVTTFGGGAGFLASFIRAGNLRGAINVLESMSESNILSTPTILALDNEEAEILVGENVPFITSETSDLGGSNSRVSIERQDVGIHLKVKAKINLNNTLTLEIEQKVESVQEKTSASVDLITSKRELKTKVIVGDGEILVLGGLIRDESQELETKVPFLGDIPIIGWLFKGTKKSMVKKNLMVLIHPTIIRDRTDSVEASIKAYQKMQVLQEHYNSNRDWLTIRPKELPLLKDLPETMTGDGALTITPTVEPEIVTPVIFTPLIDEAIKLEPANDPEFVPAEKIVPEEGSTFPEDLP